MATARSELEACSFNLSRLQNEDDETLNPYFAELKEVDEILNNILTHMKDASDHGKFGTDPKTV